MRSEEQNELIGRCIHCNCPVYKRDTKIIWTGPAGCMCELQTTWACKKCGFQHPPTSYKIEDAYDHCEKCCELTAHERR